MTDPPLPSRSQIDKLGDRLKSPAEPAQEDLLLLAEYQDSLRDALTDALNIVRSAYAETFPDRPFLPTIREKQVRSIIAKLAREPTMRLSRVQDIIGFRVVVPTILDQNALLSRIPSEGWRIRDRRTTPRHGYRAVHAIYQERQRSIEVQVRTELQHQWAELSEAVDRAEPGVKYGQGSVNTLEVLRRLSEFVAKVESLELEPLSEELRSQVSGIRQQTFGMLEAVRSELGL